MTSTDSVALNQDPLLLRVQKGDAVFATRRIINDGSVPGCEPNYVFAEAGAMGMLLNIGHFEEDPDTELFLVSFRETDGQVGPPVACLAEELSPDPLN